MNMSALAWLSSPLLSRTSLCKLGAFKVERNFTHLGLSVSSELVSRCPPVLVVSARQGFMGNIFVLWSSPEELQHES